MSRSSGRPCSTSSGGAATDAPQPVRIPVGLLDALVRACLEALPHQAYGLVGGTDVHRPCSLYPCSSNLRDTPEWTETFAAFGEFYENPDRGFVIAPGEVLAVVKRMAARGESPVGVYHSHRCRPPEPSPADVALGSTSGLLAYIVSVVNRDAPEVRVFRLLGTAGYEGVPIARLEAEGRNGGAGLQGR